MRKTIAFDATKVFHLFCGFWFCHATVDFKDVIALDNFFSESYVGLVLIEAFARLVLHLT